MFDDKQLWKDRLGATGKEMGRYLQYIFNGHLVVVMLFLLGTVAFYYQEWVQTLTPQFPAGLVMTLVLVLFVTYSPTYTFLQQPDKIFLLPVETKLTNYFFRSHIVSIVFQSYILLLLLAALMPMYVQVHGGGFQQFFFLLAVVLLFKSVNVFIRKHIYYYVEASVHQIDSVVRFFINGLGLYFLFTRANLLYVAVMFGLLVFLYVYFRHAVKEKGLKWELLVQLEEKRMGSFYRLANLFTDVPQLKEQVKRRTYVNFILRVIPFGQEQTYSYLFMRTLLRSGDYFGLIVRLTAIGSLGIYFISSGIGQLVLALLFVYLTGFQLMPLRLHHENNMLTQLYPVAESAIDQAFQRILMAVLFVQVVVFSIVVMVSDNVMNGLVTFGVSGLFAVGFVYFYSKRTWKNRT